MSYNRPDYKSTHLAWVDVNEFLSGHCYIIYMQHETQSSTSVQALALSKACRMLSILQKVVYHKGMLQAMPSMARDCSAIEIGCFLIQKMAIIDGNDGP